MHSNDFREFLFRATGEHTDVANLDWIDVHDNLICELERLGALAELLEMAGNEELSPAVGSGLALLLGDIRARMRTILELGQPKPGKKKRVSR